MSPVWNLFTAQPLEFNTSGWGWHIFNPDKFYFFVGPFDPWVFSSVTIICGLILIPASTLYLVHGGRKSMSSDKLFFGLIAFFMGWALVLGGIMP